MLVMKSVDEEHLCNGDLGDGEGMKQVLEVHPPS